VLEEHVGIHALGHRERHGVCVAERPIDIRIDRRRLLLTESPLPADLQKSSD
jgi:hypothetical protein